MILRLVCTCRRNLLNVQVMRQSDPAGNVGWLQVAACSGVHATVNGRIGGLPARQGVRANPARDSGITHTVDCRCGETWRLSEARLAQWWQDSFNASDGKIARVVRFDLGSAG